MIGLAAQEVARVVGGEILGDGAITISGAAGLDDASEKDISFFHNTKYIDSLQKTRAKVLIVPQINGDISLPQGKTFIKVSNPQWAFAQVLGLLEQQKNVHPAGIHPKAHVEASAKIGAGTRIYPGCYIGHNVTVGSNCILYPNVTLREDTQVGDRVIMHPGVVLGSDGFGFATKDGKHHKIPQIGRVVIEDDVEIGANTAVDRSTTGETRIGAGTKIDNLVHIAHNVTVGRGCLITAQVGIAGSTKIGNFVSFGGQAGVVGHIKIGDHAVIAGQTGVIGDVEPGAVLFGTPARPHKQVMKLFAIFGKLDEIYRDIKELKKKVL